MLSSTGIDNNRWENADVCMRMAEEVIRKPTGGLNSSLELWGYNNCPRYNTDRFHTYSNLPQKMNQDIAELSRQSIKGHVQYDLLTGGIMGSKGIYLVWGQKSSAAARSMFA